MSPCPHSLVSLPFLSNHHHRLADFCAIFVPSIWSSSHQKRLFIHNNITNRTFRLFCQKVLRTTEISAPCVLLALYYIHRLRSAYPAIQASIGSEVRLFTTALILANKFLDDNTFTNKTWSDVSGIPVGELNIMEIEFLSALDYTIYIHHTQFFAWVAQCQSYYRRTSTPTSNMSMPATTAAAAAVILTPPKSVKRSAAAMATPYQQPLSKRCHYLHRHVPHTPPDETSHHPPPRIVAHNNPLLYCSPEKLASRNSSISVSGFRWCHTSIMQQQHQQQQPVLSWSSSSSALASSRHTTTATPSAFVSYASVSSPSSSSAVLPLPTTPAAAASVSSSSSAAATMIPSYYSSSFLTSRVQCLEIE